MADLVSKIGRDIAGYFWSNQEFDYRKDTLETNAYPIDLSFTLEKEHLYYLPKDKDGLPQREYYSVGKQYNPTRIAAYALAHYNSYIDSRDQKHKETFLKAANWFLKSKDGRWVYNFDWGKLHAPWISAMAQGEGISVLVRAWALTKEQKYLDQAIKACHPMSMPISEGGVLSRLKDGTPFLEEYPVEKPVHVLNGFMYAIIGLVDMERITKSRISSCLRVDELIAGLEKHIDDWDIGYWSAYDLSTNKIGVRNAVTVSYHRLHTTQLLFLGEWSKSEALLKKAEIWRRYEQKLSNRMKAFIVKMIYRMMEKAQR